MRLRIERSFLQAYAVVQYCFLNRFVYRPKTSLLTIFSRACSIIFPL